MTKEVVDLNYEIEIAEHNLWVAKTIVEDKLNELNKLKTTKNWIEGLLQ